eukprot:Protomagalhaensia_wolfi_Nauph_80__2704@NODE_2836_length_972_cov_476_438371_g2225_i0_p1_GENE_NODE_2836_length_972_cov_476_438371_g2225_i0NODE_2836_length_972_cov_476_438371_g2225_i0_p1_ORF_typecomplete_len193_score25_16DUF2605/PF10792_9/0_15DTW/PF03942_15/0_18_NODE_2836_length_972_cov_476_438371_g2225_i0251829
MAADLGVRLRYIESRLGLLGQDHPKYWKTYPEPPSWLSDILLWQQAKRTTLQKEAIALLNQIDQELSVTERRQYEDRLSTVEQAIQALNKEADIESSNRTTADEGKGSVILVSRRNKGIQREVPSFNVQGGVEEDDYTGLSEIVQVSLLELTFNTLTPSLCYRLCLSPLFEFTLPSERLAESLQLDVLVEER